MFADYQIWLPFALLALLFLAFLREWAEPDVIGWAAVAVVLITGLLPMKSALKAFSNAAPITVACMFILSAALEKTGAIHWIGHGLGRFVGGSQTWVLVVLCTFTAALSAFMNNTAVVAMLVPVALSLAKSTRLSSSKLLIPLSYAAILGGTCTLIGTSTNLVVQGVLTSQKLKPIGMFEFTKLGIIYAAIGVLYLVTVGRKLLPDHGVDKTDEPEEKATLPALNQYVVSPGSTLIGKTLVETLLLKIPQADVLEVRRRGVPLQERLDELCIRAGDRVLITPDNNTAEAGLAVTEAAAIFGLQLLEKREHGFFEAVVDPNSDLPGQRIGDLRFRQEYAVRLLSLVRNGKKIMSQLGDLELESGDQLRLAGPTEGLERLIGEMGLLTVKPEVQTLPKLSIKAFITVAAFLGFVLASSFQDTIPTEGLALLSVITLLITGCLDNREAYNAVSWNIVFLIIAMLIIGDMLESTGSAGRMADLLARYGHELSPTLLIAAVYLLAMVLTELISNNAVAAMLTPIAISLAYKLGYEPRPLIIAVLFASSASFSTPVGYQTNMYIYGIGGYRFTDFFKVGIPLNIILWIAASFLIPWMWPLK
ncbi:SLC13 family permease [soil metagenome]